MNTMLKLNRDTQFEKTFNDTSYLFDIVIKPTVEYLTLTNGKKVYLRDIHATRVNCNHANDYLLSISESKDSETIIRSTITNFEDYPQLVTELNRYIEANMDSIQYSFTDFKMEVVVEVDSGMYFITDARLTDTSDLYIEYDNHSYLIKETDTYYKSDQILWELGAKIK